MNVMLINPNYVEKIYGGDIGEIIPPLGLAYIAATLRQSGIKVSILDANALALEIGEVKAEIENRNPDIVGITVPTTLVGKAEELSRVAKEVNKDTIVVAGGPHPTILPQEMLMKSEDIDICVIGEGEDTSVELVQTLKDRGSLAKVKGIAYKRGEEITINERRPPVDIDSLPFPAWDLLPLDKYQSKELLGEKEKYSTVVPSRGCPFNCIFCGQHNIFGRKVRFRATKAIVDEVEELIKKYGINSLSFSASNFTLNRQRAMDICDELIKRRIHIKWSCYTRVDIVDFELLTKMRQVGCCQVNFGIESGNQRILDILKKDITLEQARQAVKMAKKAGLRVYTYFMIGNPGETKEEIADTIAFAKELDGDYAQFAITTPFPGTELFDIMKKAGQITISDWSELKFYTPVSGIEGLSADELEKLKAKAFTSFYLRPGYMMKKALQVRSITDIKKLFQGLTTWRLLTKSEK